MRLPQIISLNLILSYYCMGRAFGELYKFLQIRENTLSSFSRANLAHVANFPAIGNGCTFPLRGNGWMFSAHDATYVQDCTPVLYGLAAFACNSGHYLLAVDSCFPALSRPHFLWRWPFILLEDDQLPTRSTRSIIAGDKKRAIGMDTSRPKAREPWKKIMFVRNNFSAGRSNFLTRHIKHAELLDRTSASYQSKNVTIRSVIC